MHIYNSLERFQYSIRLYIYVYKSTCAHLVLFAKDCTFNFTIQCTCRYTRTCNSYVYLFLIRMVAGLPSLTSADVLLASRLTSSAVSAKGGGHMTRSSTGSIYSLSTGMRSLTNEQWKYCHPFILLINYFKMNISKFYFWNIRFFMFYS